MIAVLRILHLPVSYVPWTIGGKEVFTSRLASTQRARGLDARVAFHRTKRVGEPPGSHEYDGVPVWVLEEIPDALRRSNVYQCRTPAVPGFEELVSTFRPDVVHFHDFSTGANLTHLDIARSKGAKIIMTLHSPGQICLQRELLYQGHTPCDGRLDLHRCTRCRLTVSGAPPLLAALVAGFSIPGINIDSPGAAPRALTARETTRRFRDAWRHLLAHVDRIHVLSQWMFDVLARNDVDPSLVRLCRTGIDNVPSVERTAASANDSSAGLRIAYVGRCERAKGVHVLVEAIQALPPTLAVEVFFFGPYWETGYGRDLRHRMAGDARFHEPELLDRARLRERMQAMDVCVVPSIWGENAPLTVLESFAAGVPVIASRTGGLPEMIRHDVDGLLFEPGDVDGLSALLSRLAMEPHYRMDLKRGVAPPRTIADLTHDMIDLYREMLDKEVEASPVRRNP